MSALARTLGVELPVIQAPMAGVQTGPLAVAVCNAGGLGSLPCAMLDPVAIRREVATVLASFGAVETGGARNGHVFNLGHGISQHAPPESVAVLVDAVHALSAPYHGART